MDLSIRDWMLVIGVLLILAVLLDGYRRVRKDRGRKVRMSLKPVPTVAEEELTRGELPNGGARVAASLGGHAGRSQEPGFDADWQTDFHGLSLQDDGDLSDIDLPDIDVVKSQFTSPVAPVRQRPEESAAAPSFEQIFEDQLAQSEAVAATVASVEPARETLRQSPRESVREPIREPAREAASAPDPVATASEPPSVPVGVKEIIVVNAVSKDPQGFNGEELLHILLTCDLRFGKMNIFHRYEKSNAKGPVQFSVANSVEPGTFDLNSMRNFRTPGICLFLQLPGPQDAQKALEYMVETAQCIARNLNGELRDENRSALTAQTVEHFRSRIREFDRKRMAKHA